jgi:hypothetical protein
MSDYRKEFEYEVAEAGREKLRECLEQLTTEQIRLFNLMYGSIDIIPADKMPWAYAQVKRTLEKNANKPLDTAAREEVEGEQGGIPQHPGAITPDHPKWKDVAPSFEKEIDGKFRDVDSIEEAEEKLCFVKYVVNK